MSDQLRKLMRGTILYLPAQFIPPAVQFATAVAWTYLLDPATFGFVAFIISVQEIAACFGLTIWSLFILRFRLRFGGADEKRFRLMDQRMTLAASVFQIGLTPLVLFLVGIPCAAPILAATLAYLVTRMLLTHYGDWARANQQIYAYTIGQFIGAVGGSLLSIAAILIFGPTPAAVIGAQALGQGLALLIVARQIGVHFGIGAFDAGIFQEMRKYGLPSIIAGVVGWGGANIIRVLVEYIDGPVALGLISVGWGLGQRIAGVLAMLLTAAAYPLAVKQLEDGDRQGALAQVSFNGLLLFAVLAPATAGAVILSGPIVSLMIAENFRAATIIVLPIAIAAASIRFLRIHTCDQAMLLLERTDMSLWVTIVETVLNMTFCAFGLYFYGMYGGAAGMLLGTTIASLGAFVYCFTLLGMPRPARGAIPRIVVACGVMSLCVLALPSPGNALALVSAICAGVLVYAAMIVLLFPKIRLQCAFQLRRLAGASL